MNYLTSWASPFREMTQLQKTMDKFMGDFTAMPTTRDNVNPCCEIKEDKNEYKVKFDIPGIPKDQIKIELNDNTLTVSGERKEEKREEKNHYSELSYGSFCRSFTLPTTVNPEKVMANYDNGVLSVNIAKTDASRTKQISIK